MFAGRFLPKLGGTFGRRLFFVVSAYDQVVRHWTRQGCSQGRRCWLVERTDAWMLAKRLALRCARLGCMVEALPDAAGISLVAPGLTWKFWKLTLSTIEQSGSTVLW